MIDIPDGVLVALAVALIGSAGAIGRSMFNTVNKAAAMSAKNDVLEATVEVMKQQITALESCNDVLEGQVKQIKGELDRANATISLQADEITTLKKAMRMMQG